MRLIRSGAFATRTPPTSIGVTMLRLIAVLAALAFGAAAVPALAQTTAEEKKESASEKAREAKAKAKDEATESKAEKKRERAEKKAKRKARKDAKDAKKAEPK